MIKGYSLIPWTSVCWVRHWLTSHHGYKKIDAHENMRVIPKRPRKVKTPSTNVIKATSSNSFTFRAEEIQKNWYASRNYCLTCFHYRTQHPIWKCSFQGKTPTECTKVIAGNELCFSTLHHGEKGLCSLAKTRECLKECCTRIHNTLLPKLIEIFPAGCTTRSLLYKNY